MVDAPRVLVLGLGEAGSYLAQALAAAKTAPNLLAYDAAIASPEAAALREKASTLGLDLHEDIGAWVGAVDFVLSLVPGSAAVAAARTLRPVMRPGAVYVDLNSITAAMVHEIAAIFDGSGIDLVDGAVLGNFRAGGRVPVLLAGARAEEVRDLLAGEMFKPECIAGQPGDASAIKMLRSVLMKGLEALFVESLVAAEVQGLRPAFMRAFGDLDERSFATTMEVQTVTHLVHAARRLGEIERVQSILQADGVDDTMTEASRRLYAKTVAAGVAPVSGEPLSLDETLQVLTRVFRAST
jgi:3-hydroxyisobutyrate dehydrogenase-like beta-hydroxyacid dehydrogenase